MSILEIKLEGIGKKYNDLKVIDDFSMNFSSNEVHCIFGPSGCGKSTLLNILTGLIDSYSGKIEGLEDKRFSYVFQEDRLIPWLSVKENIRFVLESNHNKAEIERTCEKYLDLVKLSNFKNNYPKELSGGMKQRVSIARALAYGGDIIVMDEPFKGLDMEIKKNMMDYITDYCKLNNKLFIYTTHDTLEAVYMADNIYVFEGPPLKLKKSVHVDTPFDNRKVKMEEIKKYEEALIMP
ncbi:ABC transporter ATP-binding protein [Clostridium neuense]|uniref:ABC transporter ATP-binding protein n=1 Tax=Clostridium neuense TaxID=1728934 RepID=A0ABW8TAC9_9CLOT